MSIPRGPSPDYLRMLRGEITSAEYIRKLWSRKGSRWAPFSDEELEDLTRTEPLTICNADLLNEIEAEIKRRGLPPSG